MRWLLHGNLSPAVAAALTAREDTPVLPETVGITAESSPAEVLAAAKKAQLDVLTSSDALAESLFQDDADVKFGRLIVYLQLEGGEVEQDDAIERLFKRYKRLTPGRLYTVTATRVKIRQLPTKTASS